jgi:hypothetical protein
MGVIVERGGEGGQVQGGGEDERGRNGVGQREAPSVRKPPNKRLEDRIENAPLIEYQMVPRLSLRQYFIKCEDQI